MALITKTICSWPVAAIAVSDKGRSAKSTLCSVIIAVVVIVSHAVFIPGPGSHQDVPGPHVDVSSRSTDAG